MFKRIKSHNKYGASVCIYLINRENLADVLAAFQKKISKYIYFTKEFNTSAITNFHQQLPSYIPVNRKQEIISNSSVWVFHATLKKKIKLSQSKKNQKKMDKLAKKLYLEQGMICGFLLSFIDEFNVFHINALPSPQAASVAKKLYVKLELVREKKKFIPLPITLGEFSNKAGIMFFNDAVGLIKK